MQRMESNEDLDESYRLKLKRMNGDECERKMN